MEKNVFIHEGLKHKVIVQLEKCQSLQSNIAFSKLLCSYSRHLDKQPLNQSEPERDQGLLSGLMRPAFHFLESRVDKNHLLGEKLALM